jgi:disulfide bond formation protein DsbB
VEKVDSSQRFQTAWSLLFAAWIVVTIATLGSLFPYDPKVVRIAGALAGVGWLIALFHVLLVAKIIPDNLQPCVQGIPCSETHISLLGFLNIPVLSLLTFAIVGVLLLYAHRMESS